MPRALITGASSGIGADLARVFASHGMDLILVARRENAMLALKDELEKSHRVQVDVFAIDLSLPHAAVKIFEKWGSSKVDILVNNAGFGDFGAFADSQLARQLELLQVNITALVELTHLFLPSLRTAGQGRILNVASTAAFVAGPGMATYYASKAFVLSFSEALSVELHPVGISVTALCPGPTATEFQKTAGISFMKILQVAGSRQVAEFGYDAMMRGKVIAVEGYANRVGLAFNKFLPRSLSRLVVQKMQFSRGKIN